MATYGPRWFAAGILFSTVLAAQVPSNAENNITVHAGFPAAARTSASPALSHLEKDARLVLFCRGDETRQER
jgi:hypothetical protein